MKILTLLPIVSFLIVINSGCSSTTNKTPGEKKDHADGQAQWSTAMIQLRTELSQLDEVLYDSKKFSNTVNDKFVGDKLNSLKTISENLKHGPLLEAKDPSLRFYASQFSRKIQDADLYFRKGERLEARQQILNLKGFCVQCHLSNPGGAEIPAVHVSFFKSLSTSDRLDYFVANRDFKNGFQQHLKLLSEKFDRSTPHERMEKKAFLAIQYAIQNLNSRKDALQVSKVIAGNSSLPSKLREQNLFWRKSIDAWKAEVGTAQEALKLFEARKSEVDTLRALHFLLPRFQQDLSVQERAELLLSVGKMYQTLSRFVPDPIDEIYFEACIRELPHSSPARSCYMAYSEIHDQKLLLDVGRIASPSRLKKLNELKALAE